jgi:hypothetical protein
MAKASVGATKTAVVFDSSAHTAARPLGIHRVKEDEHRTECEEHRLHVLPFRHPRDAFNAHRMRREEHRDPECMAKSDAVEHSEEERGVRGVHHDIDGVIGRGCVARERVLDPEAEEDERVVLRRASGDPKVKPATRR